MQPDHKSRQIGFDRAVRFTLQSTHHLASFGFGQGNRIKPSGSTEYTRSQLFHFKEEEEKKGNAL